jgi:hypothetical protein
MCLCVVVLSGCAAFAGPVATASPTTTTTTPSTAASSAPSVTNPATDNQGFVDSSARCTAAQVLIAVGSTDGSKVAICQTSPGQYEYRGVRLRDGAKLVAAATVSSTGGFTATTDGITYTLTSRSLDISDASGLIRSEPVVYYRGSATTSPAGTAAPTSGGQGAGVPVTPVTGAPAPVPTTPLPPPLPAEVGGGKTAGH